MDTMDSIYGLALDLCTNRRHLKWICPLLLLLESILCAAIIVKIPYTEIDWSTYMQQVSLFLSGERDYTLLKGSTGPLVYPASHVYIYAALHNATNRGTDIPLAQAIFAVVYLLTLALVMACYARAGAPPYVFGLLVLSKRVHSVFLLRLFNDGVATLFLWAAVYMFLCRRWVVGVGLWSVGLGVKMTLLLVAPAIVVVLILAVGLARAVGLGVAAVILQILLAMPFLQENPYGYMSKAFEFTRQFLFKWTVNWRFIGEDVFLSKTFSYSLLASHALLLAVFVAFRWIKPSGKSLPQLITHSIRNTQLTTPLTNAFILSTILESLVIGLLYARSLHYQFFAYLGWATPFVLWEARLHPVTIVAVWAAQEWAWNVYPSTNVSSAVVVMCLWTQVTGAFNNMGSAGRRSGGDDDGEKQKQKEKEKEKVHAQQAWTSSPGRRWK